MLRSSPVVPRARPVALLVLSTLVLSCKGDDGTGVDDGDAIQSVVVSPATVTVDVGASARLTATVRNRRGDVVGPVVTWDSEAPAVASVNPSGEVTGLREGSAVVTASAGGVSGSATVSVNDPNPPTAPGAAAATAVSNTSVEVSWTDTSGNEDEFRIEREAVVGTTSGTAAQVAFTGVGTVGPDVTSFLDTGLDPEASYRYRVVACNENGCSGPSTSTEVVTTFATLVIETEELPDGMENRPYEATLTAAGGDGTVEWTVTAGDLPPPLALAPATGLLSGIPDTPGDFDFTVRAEGAGQEVTRAFSVRIEEEILPPVVTTAELPQGVVGEAYSTVLDAAAGDGSYAWRTVAGSLPPGVALDAAGTLAGVPAAAGGFGFTVEVTSADLTGTAELTVDVFDALSVTTTLLPSGLLDTPYEQVLAADGGDGSYTWSVGGGSLPDGLTLATDGTLAGTPTATGTFDFTVGVASGDGQTAQAGLSLTVNAEVLSPRVTTTSLPDGGVGATYDATLQATDGDGSYTWAVTAGSLPEGLALAPGTGGIGGTPTRPGTEAFTVRVTSGGMSGTANLSITVHDALEISTSSLPDGIEGQAYDVTLTATGGNGDDTWSLASGSLPDGLSLAAGGTVSGAVAAATAPPSGGGPQPVTGTFDFTVGVANSLGQQATRALSITVHAVLEITTTVLPDGETGVPYAQTVAATGGDGSTGWSVTGGELPAGLGIDPTSGEIGGTPTAVGTSDFTVQAVSGDGQVAEQALSLTVAAGPVTVATTTLAEGEVGTAYGQVLVATGGDGEYTWARTAGDPLPDGLSLDANTGEIGGTPTTTGTSTFTVEVTSAGRSDDQELSLTVNAAPVVIENDYLMTAYPGSGYSDFVEASGGDGTFAFAVTDGALPDGLSLDASTGEIGGTAGASGAYFFTVTVTSGGNAASKTFAVATSTVAASGFNMGIMNVAGETIPSSAVIGELGDALERWEEVITGDLGDVTYPPGFWSSSVCGGDGEKLNGQFIDDMVVFVNLASLDGVGGTLANAGPCGLRLLSTAPDLNTTFGRLTLDTDDLEELSRGQLFSLIFHEIGHVVGLGTLWRAGSILSSGDDLMTGAGTSDPRYTGVGGNSVFTGTLGGGSSGADTQIPIENGGGSGTRDGHWEESEFDHEVMTGYAEASGTTQSISSMTIAAVGDFAYSVDTGAADPYSIPACAPTCTPVVPTSGGVAIPWAEILLDDIRTGPIWAVLPDGTPVRIDPGRSP